MMVSLTDLCEVVVGREGGRGGCILQHQVDKSLCLSWGHKSNSENNHGYQLNPFRWLILD